MGKHGSVVVSVAVSGSGAGLKKFVAGDIDLCQTSRPINDVERASAKKAGVEFVEIPIAFEAIAVVTNTGNKFASTLSLGEMKRIWLAESKIDAWRSVRPGFPNLPLRLYGPDPDSARASYLNDVVVKRSDGIRLAHVSSENENLIVAGVITDKGALGLLDYGHYVSNMDRLKIIKINAGKGPVGPTQATINNGTYPLAKPLFMYVKKSSLRQPNVKEFVEYLLSPESIKTIREMGFLPLSAPAYSLARKPLRGLSVGTRFRGVRPGMKIESILARKAM